MDLVLVRFKQMSFYGCWSKHQTGKENIKHHFNLLIITLEETEARNNVSEKLLEMLWLKCTSFRLEIIFGNTGMDGGNQNKRWWDALPKGTTQLNWTTEGRFLRLPLGDQASGWGSGDGSNGIFSIRLSAEDLQVWFYVRMVERETESF